MKENRLKYLHMIKIMLLHIQKYMPKSVIDMCLDMEKKNDTYELSYHMRRHFQRVDFKHNITKERLLQCANSLKNNSVIPFELEILVNNSVCVAINKFVVRMPYDNQNDISIVVRGNKIITAWLNNKDDKHYSLDLNKYSGIL